MVLEPLPSGDVTEWELLHQLLQTAESGSDQIKH